MGAATLAVFYPVYRFDFIHFDDNAYITENRVVLEGLTGRSVISAFAEGHNSSWHPLAMLSHMADVEMFGLDPGAHHLVNVILHVANVVLLFIVLAAMTGQRGLSAFVAAVFALHPLHVEPVAWISSRKDVLSTLFMLLTIAAYLRYTRTRAKTWYAAVLALFGLGLLAKPMLVTFPCLLLLLDYWPLGRITNLQAAQRAVVEKLPLFGLALAAMGATMYFQTAGGAVQSVDAFPIADRVENSIVSYIVYLERTFWPAGLAPYYPYPESFAFVRLVAAILLLASITIACLTQYRRRPYLLVGWLWFLGMLVPVIGIVQFGTHSTADRYTYVPLIGLSIALVWLVGELASRGRVQRVGAFAAIALLGVLALVSARQVQHWENDATLFAHAVAVTPPNPVAENKLGYGLQRQGQLEEAIVHFQRALELEPNYVFAHNNLGAAYAARGEWELAEQHFRKSLTIAPHGANALVGLGQVLEQRGEVSGALAAYNDAIDQDDDSADAAFHLGRLAMQRGEVEKAVEWYRRAITVGLDVPEVYTNLGNALAQTGHLDDALRAYESALKLDPRRAVTHLNMASALALDGREADAREHVHAALRLDPELAPARALLISLDAAPGPHTRGQSD